MTCTFSDFWYYLRTLHHKKVRSKFSLRPVKVLLLCSLSMSNRSHSSRCSSVEHDWALLSPVESHSYTYNEVFPEATDCHAAQCPIHQRYGGLQLHATIKSALCMWSVWWGEKNRLQCTKMWGWLLSVCVFDWELKEEVTVGNCYFSFSYMNVIVRHLIMSCQGCELSQSVSISNL